MSTWPDHDEILAFLRAHLKDSDGYEQQAMSEDNSGTLNDILILRRDDARSGDRATPRVGIRAPKQKFEQRLGRSAADVYSCVAEILPYLEARGMPVPHLLLAAGADSIFRRPCHVFDWAVGARLCDEYAEMAHADRVGILEEVGAHMARLHRVVPGDLGDSLSNRLRRLGSADRYDAEFLMASLRPHATLLDTLAPQWRDAIKLLETVGPGPQVLTHGDFYIGNVLVDDGRVASIIDWDTLGLDDPARDIVAFLRVDDCPLGIEGGRAAFFDAYRAAGGAVPDSLLSHEVRYVLTMCSLGLSEPEGQVESCILDLGRALGDKFGEPR